MQRASNSLSNDPYYLSLRAPSPLELGLETGSLNPLTTGSNIVSGRLDLNTLVTPNSVPDTPAIPPPGSQFKDNLNHPVYSYKHYKPSPTVVYTQHEEEANDLIAGLKAGYVFQ